MDRKQAGLTKSFPPECAIATPRASACAPPKDEKRHALAASHGHAGKAPGKGRKGAGELPGMGEKWWRPRPGQGRGRHIFRPLRTFVRRRMSAGL